MNPPIFSEKLPLGEGYNNKIHAPTYWGKEETSSEKKAMKARRGKKIPSKAVPASKLLPGKKESRIFPAAKRARGEALLPKSSWNLTMGLKIRNERRRNTQSPNQNKNNSLKYGPQRGKRTTMAVNPTQNPASKKVCKKAHDIRTEKSKARNI